jgi:hypothetical protein
MFAVAQSSSFFANCGYLRGINFFYEREGVGKVLSCNRTTGSQALSGNRCPEALPRLLNLEAEPLDLRFQAEPGNE